MDVRAQLSQSWQGLPRRRIILLLVIGVGVAFFLHRYLRGPLIPAVKAQHGAVIQKLVASGQIIPKTRVKISSQVMGNVAEVLVHEGDELKLDQLLLRIVSDEATAIVEQAKAAYELAQAKVDQFQGVSARLARESLRQAEVRMQKARSALKREEALAQVNVGTQEALDQARSDFQLAESQFQSAMAQAKSVAPKGSDSRMALAAVEQSHGVLAAAEAKLAFFSIAAPMTARVIQRSIEPGDGVQPGTPLFILGSLDAPRAQVQVDEKYLSLVHEGQLARVTADAYPGRSFDAKVERIAPAINQDRGSIEVQLIIPSAPPFLRFDMSASVEIVTNSAEGALILPIEAIQSAAMQHPFVLTLVGGKVTKRDVTLGLRGDTVMEITGGLSEDDIILMPTETLSPGVKARP
ncbi:MAG: efflux RND transporter periplasmic adaptor subunit, partial [Proteobacteria bacterium]|nr:efflux RND transporter periplasmic adaptor subunit [Pseudomonadota bacterium]